MITRCSMLSRLRNVLRKNVSITNYLLLFFFFLKAPADFMIHMGEIKIYYFYLLCISFVNRD